MTKEHTLERLLTLRAGLSYISQLKDKSDSLDQKTAAKNTEIQNALRDKGLAEKQIDIYEGRERVMAGLNYGDRYLLKAQASRGVYDYFYDKPDGFAGAYNQHSIASTEQALQGAEAAGASELEKARKEKIERLTAKISELEENLETYKYRLESAKARTQTKTAALNIYEQFQVDSSDDDALRCITELAKINYFETSRNAEYRIRHKDELYAAYSALPAEKLAEDVVIWDKYLSALENIYDAADEEKEQEFHHFPLTDLTTDKKILKKYQKLLDKSKCFKDCWALSRAEYLYRLFHMEKRKQNAFARRYAAANKLRAEISEFEEKNFVSLGKLNAEMPDTFFVGNVIACLWEAMDDETKAKYKSAWAAHARKVTNVKRVPDGDVKKVEHDYSMDYAVCSRRLDNVRKELAELESSSPQKGYTNENIWKCLRCGRKETGDTPPMLCSSCGHKHLELVFNGAGLSETLAKQKQGLQEEKEKAARLEARIDECKRTIAQYKTAKTELCREAHNAIGLLARENADLLIPEQWANLDAVIYYIYNGMADSVKEALTQKLQDDRTDKIVDAVKTAEFNITRTINDGFNAMRDTLVKGFTLMSHQLSAIQEQQYYNGVETARLNDNLAQIGQKIDLSNSLLDKTSVSCRELVADADYMRGLYSDAEVRRRNGL